MRLKHAVVSLLLIFGFAHAFAQPNDGKRGETTSAFYLFRAAMERGQEADRQPQRTAEQRGAPANTPDSSGFASGGDNAANAQSDASRRQGRLSPEERRALRRQIDEAGHDIYKPKR